MSASNAIPAMDHAGTAEYAETWAAIFAQVFGEVSGAPQPCQAAFAAPPNLDAPVADDLWIAGVSSGSLRGEIAFRFPPAAAVHLAQAFMGEPRSVEATLTPEYREAVVELMRQVSGLVVTALKPRCGDVPLHLEISAGAPSWPASATIWLRIGEEADACFAELHLSAALTAALRPSPAPSQTSPASAGTPPSAPPATGGDPVNLDLLMDVELAVTLRFGSRRLRLREVLDLNPGAVVDLDRQVPDPVDLLLDGRVIARGEVVVMDGNYALRVTEVAP